MALNGKRGDIFAVVLAARCPIRTASAASSAPSVARPAGMSIHSCAGTVALDARPIRRRPPLLIERQPVPHVEQRLLVHRLVLEDREHRLGAMQQRIAWAIEIGRVPAHRAPAGRPPRRIAGPSCATGHGDGRCRPVCSSEGSMPRANSVSSAGSMLAPPSARLTSVLKLKAGRWPS